MSPADAAVTLRSLQRRYGALLVPPSTEDEGPDAGDHEVPSDPAQRAGSDGTSPADHIGEATDRMAAVESALASTVGADGAEVPRAVLAPTDPRPGSHQTGTTALLEQLGTVTERLADRIEQVPAQDWARTARLEGGGEVSAEALAQEAVRAGIDGLSRARAILAEVHRRQ